MTFMEIASNIIFQLKKSHLKHCEINAELGRTQEYRRDDVYKVWV